MVAASCLQLVHRLHTQEVGKALDGYALRFSPVSQSVWVVMLFHAQSWIQAQAVATRVAGDAFHVIHVVVEWEQLVAECVVPGAHQGVTMIDAFGAAMVM